MEAEHFLYLETLTTHYIKTRQLRPRSVTCAPLPCPPRLHDDAVVQVALRTAYPNQSERQTFC